MGLYQSLPDFLPEQTNMLFCVRTYVNLMFIGGRFTFGSRDL
jgi:hypothetical protein